MARALRALRSVRQIARLAPGMRDLPRAVRRFYLRAWLAALRRDDAGALVGAAWPSQTATLLRLAGDAGTVVELGTGKAWTTAALALGRPGRRVVSYDVHVWPTRDLYAALLDPSDRERIEFRVGSADAGPAPGDPAAGFLFLDTSHEEDATVREFEAWRPALADGAAVAFHDYTNPDYPGVAAAVERLGLRGEVVDGMYVWRA